MSISGRRLQSAGHTLSDTAVSVSDVTDVVATLHWTAVPGATGYLVGRDGTDSQGHGPWQTTEASTVTSQQFTSLIPGTTYTLYCQPLPNGQRQSVQITTEASEALAYDWSDTNPPWAYTSTNDWEQRIPAGATRVNLKTGSSDFYTNLLNTVQSAGQRVIVNIPAGTFHLNQFRGTAGSSWGFQIGNLQGICGAGADKTIIQMDANSMSQNELDFIQTMGTGQGPLLTGFCRLDGTSASPVYLGGLTFQAADQQTMTSLDSSLTALGCVVAQPAPHRGVVISANSPGIVSHVRFRAPGRALLYMPPFECGTCQTQYSTSVYYNCEFDGRRAPDIDPAQPRRCTVYLGNNETSLTQQDCWFHHANTSKYAINDQNKDTQGTYNLIRCKFNNIGDGNNVDPNLNGGVTLGGGTYGCTMGWEDSNATVNITDCIIVVDKTQTPHTRHIQFTTVAARNPQGGRLHVSGGSFRNTEYPTIDGYLTIWADTGTYWQSDGYATTMDVKVGGVSLTAYEQTSGWPPSAGQLASLSPSANFLVTQYN